LLALCVAGAAVRFATLGQQSFWLDEAITGRLMRLGFSSMLRAIPRSESTPPLYYVVAWIWTRVFGVSEVGLRSLSAVLGTLTIALLYGAAARLFDRRAGLFAAALGAFAPLLIWYSQEARSYALLLALCAAGLWAFAAALEPGAGRRALWLWAIAGGLALATHYFAIFIVGPELCWLAWRLGRRALPALAVPVVIGLAVAPLALHQRANGTAGFIAQTPLRTRLAQAVKQLALGYDAPAETVFVVFGLVFGVAVAWLFWSRIGRSARRAVLGLAGLGGAAVLLPLLGGLVGLDYLITRNLIVAWVPVAVAIAAILARSGRAGTIVLIGLCGLGLAATLGIDLDSRYQRDDWRGAAHVVPAGSPSVVVLTPSSGRLAFGYYLPDARTIAPTGATVSSVEVIGLGARGVGAPVQAPPVPIAPLLLPGFQPPSESSHGTFSVVHYRASDGPVLVTPTMLIPLALAVGGSAQLVTDGGS
jgi:hypothetical protein